MTRTPLRVCSFESRRAAEMQTLIEKLGGAATIAPSMREIPLDQNPDALAFAEALLAGTIDVVIFLTGVGARALLEAVETRHARSEFFEALNRGTTVVRGPKPTAVLREWGVRIDHRAPEPNTWRDLLATLEAEVPLEGRHVAVQEYGKPNEEFYRELQQRGARVTRVPVYRWALPEDTSPLKDSIRTTIAGGFDVLMFTSAQQLHNVLEVAEAEGVRDEWIAAARRCVVASIGPTASETLAEEGLPADLEPTHPRMGHLVRETLERASTLLNRKR